MRGRLMTDDASQTDTTAGPAALGSKFQATTDEVAALYDEWADTYDTDIDASDYDIPDRRDALTTRIDRR